MTWRREEGGGRREEGGGRREEGGGREGREGGREWEEDEGGGGRGGMSVQRDRKRDSRTDTGERIITEEWHAYARLQIKRAHTHTPRWRQEQW